MNCRFTVRCSTSFSTTSFCVEIQSPCLGLPCVPPNQPPDLTATMFRKRYCFPLPIIDKRVGRAKTRDEGVLQRNLIFFTLVSGRTILEFSIFSSSR
jgi:hypothetical protein